MPIIAFWHIRYFSLNEVSAILNAYNWERNKERIISSMIMSKIPIILKYIRGRDRYSDILIIISINMKLWVMKCFH